MNEVKPGWKTSEMYLAIATQLLQLLVLTYVVEPTDQATLADAISKIVLGVASVLTGGGVVWAYIKSRTAVKTGT